MTSEAESVRFGEGRFELQPRERLLLVDGASANLGARAFDLLLELVRQPGKLRTKNELLEAVWTGVVVEEGNLAVQMSTLRKILGGEIIATIPGRGYRFTAPVHRGDETQGPASGGTSTHQAPPPAPPAPRLQTNLPATLPHLVGRSEDLAALHELVEQHRLVSIIGAGGMGKTTVALHLTAARQQHYRHGVCWVELSTVTHAEALPSAIAAAIGVRPGSGEPLAGLCAALMALEMLVVLDNAEQVAEGVAHVVQALLEKAPGLRCVVTTQVPLKLAAERAYRIDPLAVPQGSLPAHEALAFGAVALFVERAQAADARFTLTDANAPAVIELCRQLDGLALAIELAAARAPMLGAHKLAASMGDRLQLLTSARNRMAPARQQTLRATLEWSHGFLDEAERCVFRRLAVFAGSGSLAMVQQVVADPPGEGALDEWAVLDALSLLVDRSLVVALTTDDGSEPRYRLQDSPRAFALERLKEAGEEPALRLRHMQAMAAFCEASWHVYFAGEMGREAWRRDFGRDADNAAEAQAQAEARGDALATLQIWVTSGLLTSQYTPPAQRIDLAERRIDMIDDTVPPALRVRALTRAALQMGNTRPGRAAELLRQALSLVRRHPDLRQDRFLCYLVFCLFVNRQRLEDPETLAALAEARALEDPRWPAQRRVLRCDAESEAADPESPEALSSAREAVALSLAAGDYGFVSRGNLIDAELAAGDAEAAARTGEALLADLHGRRLERASALTRLNLAAAWLKLDQWPRARELAQIAWPQGRLFGFGPYWTDYLALLAALEARPRAAARLAGCADASYAARDESRQPNEAAAHQRACTLARASLGDTAFEQLLADGRRLGEEQVEAIAFGGADEG